MTDLDNSLIVIIDDSAVNNFICEILIQEYSSEIKIESYSLSEEGINAINNHKSKISLLLLDLSMPVFDGWDILEKIELEKINIPTVILTSSLNTDDFEKSKKYNFVTDFLIKPATYDTIKPILETLSLNRI